MGYTIIFIFYTNKSLKLVFLPSLLTFFILLLWANKWVVDKYTVYPIVWQQNFRKQSVSFYIIHIYCDDNEDESLIC